MLKKGTLLWREVHFQVKRVNLLNTEGFGPLLDVQMSFREAGAREWDCAPCQKSAKIVAVSETMAGMGHLKRICKDACRMASAIQETCSSEMLGG